MALRSDKCSIMIHPTHGMEEVQLQSMTTVLVVRFFIVMTLKKKTLIETSKLVTHIVLLLSTALNNRKHI